MAAATASAGLGLHSTANNPAWLAVYLGVAKLLDQAVVLPADQLPQFQMYRWAFVREGEVSRRCEGRGEDYLLTCSLQETEADLSQVSNNNGPLHQDFVPHVARISKLMKTKVEPGEILQSDWSDSHSPLDVSAGQVSPTAAHRCWGATADHASHQLPGGPGPLVQHPLPLPHQAADPQSLLGGREELQGQVTTGHDREDH